MKIKRLISNQSLSYIGIIYILFGISYQFCINIPRIISPIAFLFTLFLSCFHQKSNYLFKFITIISLLSFFFHYRLFIVALGIFLLGVGDYLFFKYLKKVNHHSLSLIIFSLTIIPSLFITITTIDPSLTLPIIRKLYNIKNTTTIIETGTHILSNNITLNANLTYSKNYPNSYLDIYYTTTDLSKPTIIYLHKGGFLWGDKVPGNPLTMDNNFKNSTIYTFITNNYNVVSLDYALTPQNHYPTPIKQLHEGLKYLLDNSEKLNLNMSSIILIGQSAGANLASSLTNLETNPDYASLLEEIPYLQGNQLKGLILEGGFYRSNNIGKTNNLLYDWLFYNMGRLYYQEIDLTNNSYLKETSVFNYVNSNYPKTFISDGNTATFWKEAQALDQKLTNLNVPHTLNYYPHSRIKLIHCYEEKGNIYSQQTQQNILKFVQDLT